MTGYVVCYEFQPRNESVQLSILPKDELHEKVKRRRMKDISHERVADQIVRLVADVLLKKKRVGEASFLIDRHEAMIGLDTWVFFNSKAYLIAIAVDGA